MKVGDKMGDDEKDSSKTTKANNKPRDEKSRDEAEQERDRQAALKLAAERAQIEQSMEQSRELHQAMLRKTLAEITQIEAAASVASLQAAATAQSEAWRLADNRFHHVYMFTEPVNGQSVSKCMTQLDVWKRVDPGCPITIVFNSPGGGVIDGMALFDYILQLRASGHKVTTKAMGFAASMAGILLQAGDVRQMGREAYLLIHEISTVTGGTMGQIEDEVTFLKKIQSRIVDIFAERAKISRARIEKGWKRKDWWLDSTEALKLGFVDEIV